MNRNFIYLIFIILVIFLLYTLTVFIIKDQYDSKLIEISIKNEKLQKSIDEKNLVIESLLDGVECDCGFYEDYYYDHSFNCGAYE